MAQYRHFNKVMKDDDEGQIDVTIILIAQHHASGQVGSWQINKYTVMAQNNSSGRGWVVGLIEQ